MLVSIPYGKSHIHYIADDKTAVLQAAHAEQAHAKSEAQIVSDAMRSPVSGAPLFELAQGKRNAVIIISDHTRPVPSKWIIPPMLAELRRANASINITLLVATGCHRETTAAELADKLGEQIVAEETISIHDCDNDANMVLLGILPSGAELRIHKLAAEADLLLAEGFIEPHFFAGFSGGRKSVLPGIADRNAVLGNHCAQFIASEYAQAGILSNNPIHEDMVVAARLAKLSYIVNVVIDSDKKIVAAFAGATEAAHLAGCEFVSRRHSVDAVKADIVIAGNGGYPLDQNIYQAVKGMTTAAMCNAAGGVIIMLAECSDGIGGDFFYHLLRDCATPQALHAQILSVPQSETQPDQWQVQILARILMEHTAILVADSKNEAAITEMKMRYACNLEHALQQARAIKGENASVAVMPDGVSVIVR